MLIENDICFSDEDEKALIDSVAVGEEYKIRGVIIVIWDENRNIEWIRRISTYDWFTQLLSKAVKIECVNDDCSVVRFVDSEGNELEQLTTTPEFGSVLSSNPTMYFGHATFTKK